MTPERFFADYQAGPHLIGQVTGEQERLQNPNSPLIYLADRLVETARQEMRGISDSHNLPPTPEASRFLLGQAVPHAGAIIFGTSVKGLMEWDETGYFEHDVLRSRLDNALTGTPIPNHKRPEWLASDHETVAMPKLAAIKQRVIHDPTFSFFFENPEYMPDGLKRYLDDLNFFKWGDLPVLNGRWKEIANYLVTNKKVVENKPLRTLLPAVRPLVHDQVAKILDELEF